METISVADKTRQEVGKASYANLIEALEELNTIADDIKAAMVVISGEISERLGESAKQSFENAKKDRGTINLPLQDGVTAKCVIDKKVDWDSEKLLAVAQTLPWDRASALFKIKFSMSETIYTGLKAADPDMAARVAEARTETLSAPKITLSKEGA